MSWQQLEYLPTLRRDCQTGLSDECFIVLLAEGGWCCGLVSNPCVQTVLVELELIRFHLNLLRTADATLHLRMYFYVYMYATFQPWLLCLCDSSVGMMNTLRIKSPLLLPSTPSRLPTKRDSFLPYSILF